jgi:Zn-finger nucleic acid-binding protein
MPDAGALNCPGCGAPAGPETTSCQYCGTLLALTSCPQCFARLFRGWRHCPVCATKLSRQEGEAVPRNCPGCQKKLSQVLVGTLSIDECGSCRGIWVDADSFEQLCEDRQEQSTILGRAAVVHPEAKAKGRRLYIPCPVCRQLMLPVNFAKRSGIVIDVCREHGVWFDRDELHQVVRFISAGGYLEETIEKERERLEAERRHLQQSLYPPVHGADAALLPSGPEVDVQAIVASARHVLELLGRRRSGTPIDQTRG